MSMVEKSVKPTFPALQSFPRNQWYVAAFAQDIGKHLVARTLLETPLVMYRDEDGAARIFYDRCPHRGLPLSMGTLSGDRLICAYHGLEFDKTGKCVRIPQQDKVYAGLRAREFPVVEDGPFVWVWLGDDQPDHSIRPTSDWIGFGRPGYHDVPYFTYPVDIHYQFLHDNLSDLSHISYLHAGLLDGGGMASTEAVFEDEGPILKSTRFEKNVILPDIVAQLFRANKDHRYDRSFVIESFVPSLVIGRQIMQDIDDTTAAPLEFIVINAVTPVSMNKSIMFHIEITPYPHGSEADREYVFKVLEQDRIALEVLQWRFERFGDISEVSIISDTAGLKTRKLLDKMMMQERKTAAE